MSLRYGCFNRQGIWGTDIMTAIPFSAIYGQGSKPVQKQ